MVLTKEKIQSLDDASRPLMKWLKENCHPHVIVIVDSESAEALEGLATIGDAPDTEKKT